MKLLYDAECPFCTWATGMLVIWDRERRIAPVALQGAEAERLLPDLSPEERMEAAHVVTSDGERHSGGDAFAPLFAALPAGGPLAGLAGRFPRAARRLYDVTSRHRGKLVKLLPARFRRFAARRLRRREGASDAAPSPS